MAVPPSVDRARLVPNSAPWPLASAGTSLGPRCVNNPPLVKIHAAPVVPSLLAPIRAVCPSPESATLAPNLPRPLSSLAVSFGPSSFQVLPKPRVNAHAAPVLTLSAGPPISAVLPSPEIATLAPNLVCPLLSPAPVNADPCWVHGVVVEFV